MRSCGYGHAALQQGNGSRHRWVPCAGHALQQHRLEHAELLCWCGCLTQTLAKQATVASPDMVEFNDLVTRLAEGHPQKCGRSAQPELHRDESPLCEGVDGGESPMWARQDCTAGALDRSALRAMVRPKLILLQINHITLA